MKSRFVLLLLLLAVPALAQQSPYFVTYDHHLEEPGNLEISSQSTVGFQKQNLPAYLGQLAEFEYGVKGWWTTSLYLEGATQSNDATVFTGFRLENRFKPLQSEHRINPVFYFEYENVNEASRIRKDIVGYAGPSDESLSDLRGETAREIETKLILSSNFRNWNVAGNFVVEKNLSEDEGFEFGYALGAYRPLSTLASGNDCHFCPENFAAGVEMYGGLGSTEGFGLQNTEHYIAPALSWTVGGNSTLRISPGFGITRESARMLLRIGYTYEIEGFGSKILRLLGGHQ